MLWAALLTSPRPRPRRRRNARARRCPPRGSRCCRHQSTRRPRAGRPPASAPRTSLWSLQTGKREKELGLKTCIQWVIASASGGVVQENTSTHLHRFKRTYSQEDWDTLVHSSDHTRSLSKQYMQKTPAGLLPESASSSQWGDTRASQSQHSRSLTDRSDWSGASRGCDQTGNTTHATVVYYLYWMRIHASYKTMSQRH